MIKMKMIRKTMREHATIKPCLVVICRKSHNERNTGSKTLEMAVDNNKIKVLLSNLLDIVDTTDGKNPFPNAEVRNCITKID